ncbi:MAG TPA: hypothetical protein VF062_16180 [Candidatus Limnocylindrales bacterium]
MRGDAATLGGSARGLGVRRRRLGLGIKSVREFAERSGVSREAVTAAENGTASNRTYGRLEAWLNRAEHADSAGAADQGQVEFRVSGGLGVDVVVRGPVADLAELEASVTRLIREVRQRASTDGG